MIRSLSRFLWQFITKRSKNQSCKYVQLFPQNLVFPVFTTFFFKSLTFPHFLLLVFSCIIYEIKRITLYIKTVCVSIRQHHLSGLNGLPRGQRESQVEIGTLQRIWASWFSAYNAYWLLYKTFRTRSIGSVHITLKRPVLVRSLNTSNVERG